ncbi:MAG: four helix bundle protein [Bacteroidetes bacterium]|nr:four helix bundle protein [Bacteroidota bacterium]
MGNKAFGKQLEVRTKKICNKHYKNQLTKSGTSIGANYREANRARSKADFRNKIKISESEASETVSSYT